MSAGRSLWTTLLWLWKTHSWYCTVPHTSYSSWRNVHPWMHTQRGDENAKDQIESVDNQSSSKQNTIASLIVEKIRRYVKVFFSSQFRHVLWWKSVYNSSVAQFRGDFITWFGIVFAASYLSVSCFLFTAQNKFFVGLRICFVSGLLILRRRKF